MRKIANFVLGVCVLVVFAAFVSAQDSSKLITANSAGSVKLGMTVADARKALKGAKFERTSDGEGAALIAVSQGKEPFMGFYAGEIDNSAPINENAVIEFIEVFGGGYKTAEGVSAGMKIADVEKKYGKVREIMMSEIEAREFADFTNHPKGLQFRVMNDDGMAGVYKEGGEMKSTQYAPNAYVSSIQVAGTSHFQDDFTPDPNAYFSSFYTDLQKDCKSEGGEEGGHVSTMCEYVGAYRLHYFDSAAALHFSVEVLGGTEESINLATQKLDYDTKPRKIEWRMANGKPFAVIMRVEKFKVGDDGMPGKTTGEVLIVKGLNKFGHIDYEVDPKRTRNANEEARKLADAGYLKR